MNMHTFKQICDGKCYSIPGNQRGFSWEDHNVEDLFRDLYLVGTHSHYMGTLIVSKTDTDPIPDDDLAPTMEYCLEDGQQRITAFFIVLNSVRKRIEEIEGTQTIDTQELERLIFYKKSGRAIPRLTNENPELQQCFENILLGSPTLPPNLSPPGERLLAVRDYSERKIATYNLTALVELKQRFSNLAKFIFVDLKQENVNRYLTFDAINSRGLPLSEFDKIKNFCMAVYDQRSMSGSVEDSWFEAIKTLQKYGVASRSKEAAFIADMYQSFHDVKAPQDEVHGDFVQRYRSLLTSSDRSLEQDLISFVALWPRYAESYGFVTSDTKNHHFGTACSDSAGDWLEKLDHLDMPGVTRLIIAASHLRMSTTDFSDLVQLCEKYTFRVHAVFRRRKDNRSRELIALANAILRNNQTLSYVQARICRWLSEDAPLLDIISKLADGGVKYPYDRRSAGWPECYYFLYEYEMAHSPAGSPVHGWSSVKMKRINSIEHILPQTHRDGAWWQQHWPDEAEAEKFKHRLGNLVLTANNGALGRKEIAHKINDPSGGYSFNSPNATNTEKLVQRYTAGGDWRKDEILKREVEILRFAKDRWSVPCCADNGDIPLPEQFVDSNQQPIVFHVAKTDCIEEETSELPGDDSDDYADDVEGLD